MTSIRPWAMRLAVLACASIAPHFTAHASGTAQASLSGLTFALIDLAPNDGVAPAFTLLDQGLDAGAYLQAYSAINAWDNVKRDFMPITQTRHDSANALLSAAASNANATAQSTRTPAGVFSASSQLSTQSINTPSLTTYTALQMSDGELTSALHDSLGLPPSGDHYLPVTLSPHTRLVVTAQASVQASVSHDNAPYSEYQKATASLALQDGFNAKLAEDNIMAFDTEDHVFSGDVPVHQSLARQLTLTFDNTGPLAQRLQLLVGAEAVGSALMLDPPPAVPEAATWAQMGLGSVLIALMTLRRTLRKP